MYPHPTPVELLGNLTKHLCQSIAGLNTISPQFWIKHEDTNSALAYGGNKVRKLEYVIADAVNKGTTHLVTVGGVQSNSQRQVTAAGNKYGLRTILTPDPKLGNPPMDDRHAYDTAGNVQINSILGASWIPSTAEDDQCARKTDGLVYEIAASREMDRIKAVGGHPYFIPSGASLHPLGGLGFARFAFELAQQEEQMGVRWDTIIVSCASGSTLGGMVAGFKLLEKEQAKTGLARHGKMKRRLIGIQATSCDLQETERVVMTSARNTTKLIGLEENDIERIDFELDGRFNGGAYGALNPETQSGIKLLAEKEGILTDPVYTGKAIAGIIRLAKEGAFESAENVLFVHTGGTPAIAAYPSMR